MAQLIRPAEPFGEVNVYRKPDGGLHVVATILMVPDPEGARTALALDASSSMRPLYGITGIAAGAFAKLMTAPNLVEPTARNMAAFLTRFAADGRVSVLYWACGPDGSLIEEIGTPTGAEATSLKFTGPAKVAWGRGTRLLPPIRHLAEGPFAAAPWAIAVLLTDGVIEDLPQVKDYSLNLARQIASGQRQSLKLVLLGIGPEVDRAQLEELDDMFNDSDLRDQRGRPIDLWDHKLTGEMRSLEEIFAEVVAEDVIVAPNGRVFGPPGTVARDYPNGLPALLRFDLPADVESFTLEFPGNFIVQDIRAGVVRV